MAAPRVPAVAGPRCGSFLLARPAADPPLSRPAEAACLRAVAGAVDVPAPDLCRTHRPYAPVALKGTSKWRRP